MSQGHNEETFYGSVNLCVFSKLSVSLKIFPLNIVGGMIVSHGWFKASMGWLGRSIRIQFALTNVKLFMMCTSCAEKSWK